MTVATYSSDTKNKILKKLKEVNKNYVNFMKKSTTYMYNKR